MVFQLAPAEHRCLGDAIKTLTRVRRVGSKGALFFPCGHMDITWCEWHIDFVEATSTMIYASATPNERPASINEARTFVNATSFIIPTRTASDLAALVQTRCPTSAAKKKCVATIGRVQEMSVERKAYVAILEGLLFGAR